MTTTSHAEGISEAITSGLEVLSDDDHPDREDYDRVRALVAELGVVAVLAALRDGADCAAHAALGGSHGADLFDGVTADDLHRATYCLARAVEAVGGGSGAAR